MNLLYYIGNSLNPYKNLATEEYLLTSLSDNTCILYLWQNDNTIVIGRNQNCWKECKTDIIKKDGCFIARRLSGGGAVFHDMGNLNFTFLVNSKDYDLEKQISVIASACRSLGLDVRPSGRNDITVNDKKFSGNAFYQSKNKRYHHGTILISANLTKLSDYLNVSLEKMKSKGVSSVKSRVVNLSELNPEITVDKMKEALIKSFGEIYRNIPKEIDEKDFDHKHISELTARNSSWEWIFGSNLPFSFEIIGQFKWGGIEIRIESKNGHIVNAIIFSDMMELDVVDKIKEALIGCRFDIDDMANAIFIISKDVVYNDIAGLIRQQNI